MDEGQLLLLWPGEVRRKREGDFGQIGPALLAGTNNRPSFINKIPSTSYLESKVQSLIKFYSRNLHLLYSSATLPGLRSLQ